MYDEKTVTLAPRGSAKTTIQCFLIPIYLSIVHPKKFKHFLNIQSTSTKALAINISIKSEFESNDILIKDYGNLIGNKWTERQFVLKNGVVFTAIGTGDSVRGTQYKNIRPDYIIPDDIYDEDDMYNVERIKKIERWFWGAIYMAVPKQKKYCFKIQGTAIHTRDLMHTLKTKEGWKFKKFKSIIDFEKKIVLWPSVESFEKLLRDREQMGTIIFNREMQNEARNDEDSVIKESQIQYFNGDIPIDEEVVYKSISIDPATDENTRDYTAIIFLVKTKKGNIYVCDAYEMKLSQRSIKEKIIELGFAYKPDDIAYEAISAFRHIPQQLTEETGLPIRWKELKSETRSKKARLIACQHYFENMKVFFSTEIEKTVLNRLVEQLLEYTNENDDLRDALLIGIEEKYRGIIVA